MKKTMIILISALILLGSISVASASFIASGQRVYFESTGSGDYYWAMVWDYTLGYRESATSGYINYDAYLLWSCAYNSVQVAYIYDVGNGRYEEALALRDVNL